MVVDSMSLSLFCSLIHDFRIVCKLHGTDRGTILAPTCVIARLVTSPCFYILLICARWSFVIEVTCGVHLSSSNMKNRPMARIHLDTTHSLTTWDLYHTVYYMFTTFSLRNTKIETNTLTYCFVRFPGVPGSPAPPGEEDK